MALTIDEIVDDFYRPILEDMHRRLPEGWDVVARQELRDKEDTFYLPIIVYARPLRSEKGIPRAGADVIRGLVEEGYITGASLAADAQRSIDLVVAAR